MGAIGTIGVVDAKFSADTKQAEASLDALGAKSESTGKKMEMAMQFAKSMGNAIDEIGPKTERAAAIQERAAERMRRAWQQEVLQQNRSIDAEQQAARAKELAALKADILSRSLENQAKAQQFVNSATEASIPQYAAASGVVRALEGGMNNNIRAAERFLSTTLGLGPVLQTLFPIAGALAFVDILVRMGEKVADLIQNWEGVRDAEDAAMKAMADSDRAVVEASAEHVRMMREQRVLNAELQASPATRDAAGQAAGAAFDIVQQRELAASLQDQIVNARKAIVNENLVHRAADLAVDASQWHGLPGETPVMVPKTADAAIAASKLQGYNAEIATAQTQLRNAQAQILLLSSEGALRQREVAEGGGRGDRRDASQQMQAAAQRLEAMKAQHTVSLDEEAAYWQHLADRAKNGSAFYSDALDMANKARAKSQQEYQQSFVSGVLGNIRAGEEAQASSDRVTAAITETWDAAQKRDEEAAKAMREAAVRAFEQAERQRQMADRVAEERIRLEEASGRLSKHEAALALQALNEGSFAQWSAASASFSAAFPDVPVPGAEEAVGQHGMQAMQFAAQVRATEGLQEFSDGLARTAQQLLDWGAKLAQLFGQTVGDLNKDIIDSLSMRHPRVNWGNTGATFFRGVANVGLESAEGQLMKALGLGSLKKRQEANVWVQNWPGGGMGGSSSSSGTGSTTSSILGKAGGWLGGLFGGLFGGGAAAGGTGLIGADSGMLADMPLFPPGFASGGPIPSNMPAIVGERGPELFVPSSAGHIVPHGSFSTGGSVTHNISIDARGATDPAAVYAATNRALAAAMPRIIAASQAASRDAQARRVTPSFL